MNSGFAQNYGRTPCLDCQISVSDPLAKSNRLPNPYVIVTKLAFHEKAWLKPTRLLVINYVTF
jgi:hypothetical protein